MCVGGVGFGGGGGLEGGGEGGEGVGTVAMFEYWDIFSSYTVFTRGALG